MFESLNQGISTTKGILIVVLVAAIAGVGILAYQYYWLPEPVTLPIQPPIDETADWSKYESIELGLGFKYPSEWKTPEVKEESQGKCSYQEIELGSSERIYIRPKTEAGFLCFEPQPYFECGKYYFECSPVLTSFNCQPYKDASGDYNSTKIWNDLKNQGFDCGISVGRIYPPYIYNSDLLQDQFEILEKANQATVLTEDLEEEIKSDFLLSRQSFIVGSDDKFYVDLINNSQIGVRGIKIIGYEGSDVDAQNYYYRAIFLKDDRIIFTDFSLFYDDVLEWANEEMFTRFQEGGKSFTDLIIDDIENKSEQSPIYKIVKEYDLVIKSIHTLDGQTQKDEKFTPFNSLQQPPFIASLNNAQDIKIDFHYEGDYPSLGWDPEFYTPEGSDEKFLSLSKLKDRSGQYAYGPEYHSVFNPEGSHWYGGTPIYLLNPNSKHSVSYIGLQINNKDLISEMKIEFGIDYMSELDIGQSKSSFLASILGIEPVYACGYGLYLRSVGDSNLTFVQESNGITWYRLEKPIALYNLRLSFCDEDCSLMPDYCPSDGPWAEPPSGCEDYYCCYYNKEVSSLENGNLRMHILYKPNDKEGFLKLQMVNLILNDAVGNYYQPTIGENFNHYYRAYLH